MSSLYNKNAGHGITGSKNVFSTKVHLGNWREDIIGKELVQDILDSNGEDNHMGRSRSGLLDGRDTISRNRKNSFSTSSQVIGSNTRLKKNPGSDVKFLTQEELKTKNKDGLNYFLLFSHGNNGEDISHMNRYTSQNRLSTSRHLMKSSESGLGDSTNMDSFPETNNNSGFNDTGGSNTNSHTHNTRSQTKNNVDAMFPPVEFSYTKSKNKIIKNDLELNLKMTTTARLANKYTGQYPPDQYSAPHTAVGRSEILPSARR